MDEISSNNNGTSPPTRRRSVRRPLASLSSNVAPITPNSKRSRTLSNPSSPEARVLLPLVIQQWLSIGIDRGRATRADLKKHLESTNSALLPAFETHLKERTFRNWRKRLVDYLTQHGHQEYMTPDHGLEPTAEFAHEVYLGCLSHCKTGRPVEWPTHLDDRIQEAVERHRRSHLTLLVPQFREIVRRIASTESPQIQETFRSFCDQTYRRKLDELNYNIRRTSNDSSLPAEWEEMCKIFVFRLMEDIRRLNVPPALVLNLDESGLFLYLSFEKTYEKASVTDVNVVGSNEKRSVTVTPVVTAQGHIACTQVCMNLRQLPDAPPPFDGSKHYHLAYHRWVYSSTGRKHWQTFRSLQQLFQDGIQPYVQMMRNNYPDAKAAIVILDLASVHVKEEFLEYVKSSLKDIKLHFVPPKCTRKVQPLDLTVFSMMKPMIRRACTKYIVDCAYDNGMSKKPTPERRKALRKAHARKLLLHRLLQDWLPNCYKAIQPHSISRGFTQCAQVVFPSLNGLFRHRSIPYTFADPEYYQVRQIEEKAAEYPPFHEIVRRSRCGAHMKSPYAVLRKSELSSLCAARGLLRTGTNEALVKRLDGWDAANEPGADTNGSDVDDTIWMENGDECVDP